MSIRCRLRGSDLESSCTASVPLSTQVTTHSAKLQARASTHGLSVHGESMGQLPGTWRSCVLSQTLPCHPFSAPYILPCPKTPCTTSQCVFFCLMDSLHLFLAHLGRAPNTRPSALPCPENRPGNSCGTVGAPR